MGESWYLWFLTRSNTNLSIQSQKKARSLTVLSEKQMQKSGFSHDVASVILNDLNASAKILSLSKKFLITFYHINSQT